MGTFNFKEYRLKEINFDLREANNFDLREAKQQPPLMIGVESAVFWGHQAICAINVFFLIFDGLLHAGPLISKATKANIGVTSPLAEMFGIFCALLSILFLFKMCSRWPLCKKNTGGKINCIASRLTVVFARLRSRRSFKSTTTFLSILKSFSDKAFSTIDYGGRFYFKFEGTREFFEIFFMVSLLVQLSQDGMQPAYLIVTAILVAINCSVTPFLLFSQNPFLHHSCLLLLDTSLDTLYGAILPLAIVIPAFGKVVASGVGGMTEEATMEGIIAAKMLSVTSFSSFAMKMFPLISNSFLIHKMGRSVEKVQRSSQVVPFDNIEDLADHDPSAVSFSSSPTSSFSHGCSILFKILGVLVAFLAVTFVSIRISFSSCGDASDTFKACSIEAYPLVDWSTSCACVLMNTQCQHMVFSHLFQLPNCLTNFLSLVFRTRCNSTGRSMFFLKNHSFQSSKRTQEITCVRLWRHHVTSTAPKSSTKTSQCSSGWT